MIRNSLIVEFPCLVCDKPAATNNKTVAVIYVINGFIYTATISAKTNTKNSKKITTLGFVNCVYEWKFPFIVSAILKSPGC